MKEVFDLLNPANTISVNRALAHAVGLNEAVVFAALASKSNYYKTHDLSADGWFYSTVEDLQESTALSEKQQRTAIKKLVHEGLLLFDVKGMPARRYFKVVEDTELLSEVINSGIEQIREIKPSASEQMDEYKAHVEEVSRNDYYDSESEVSSEVFNSFNDGTNYSSAEKAEQVLPKRQNKFRQKVSVTYKTKENKSLVNNLSIAQSADMIDTIDFAERENYYETVKENIGYDYLCSVYKDDKDRIDEITELITDTVNSKRKSVRICGENKPLEVVKSVFLKLNEGHIEYVLDSMKHNTAKIRNIRNYLLTALYNSKFTINNYYQFAVNYGLYRAKT